jgi:hypothetical protein
MGKMIRMDANGGHRVRIRRRLAALLLTALVTSGLGSAAAEAAATHGSAAAPHAAAAPASSVHVAPAVGHRMGPADVDWWW